MVYKSSSIAASSGSSGGGGGGIVSINSDTTAAQVISAGSGISLGTSAGVTTISAIGGGSGTVTSISGVTANGFAFSIANPTTTPAITGLTTVTGILQGNGTAISAVPNGGISNILLANSAITIGAQTGLSGGGSVALGSAITLGMATNTANTLSGYNNSGVFSDVAIGSNLSLSGGVLSATAGSGGSTSVNAYSLFGNNTSAATNGFSIGSIIVGTPGYSATGYNMGQISFATNNFTQLSIQNTNAGSASSTDYIATADNGNDNQFYINTGINSSVAGVAPFTNANAGYLYVAGNELDIAAISTGGVIKFYTGGGLTPTLGMTLNGSQNLAIVGSVSAVSGAYTGVLTNSKNGALSQSSIYITGVPLASGGTGTTTFPLMYFDSGASKPTTLAVAGTVLGFNMVAGFAGTMIDMRINGSASVFNVSNSGTIINSGNVTCAGVVSSTRNGAASVSPLLCSGSLMTNGTGTTNFPHFRIEPVGVTAVTTWNTNGTAVGVNLASGSTANFLDFHVSGGVSLYTTSSTGKLTNYGGVATAGWGVPAIYASSNISQSTNATITSYNNPAADGDFEVSAQMNVSSATAISTSLNVTYTDVNNTAQTMILPVVAQAGTFLTGGLIVSTGTAESPVMHIRAKASTTITILTAPGTFTGVAYSASGKIKQTA